MRPDLGVLHAPSEATYPAASSAYSAIRRGGTRESLTLRVTFCGGCPRQVARQQRVEVTAARGAGEGAGRLCLAGPIGAGSHGRVLRLIPTRSVAGWPKQS